MLSFTPVVLLSFLSLSLASPSAAPGLAAPTHAPAPIPTASPPPRLTRRAGPLLTHLRRQRTRTAFHAALAHDRAARRAWFVGTAAAPLPVFAGVVRAIGAHARQLATAGMDDVTTGRTQPVGRVAHGAVAELRRLRDVLRRWAGERPAGNGREWAERRAVMVGEAAGMAEARAARRYWGPGRAASEEARGVAAREARVVQEEYLAPLEERVRMLDPGWGRREAAERARWAEGVGRELDRMERRAGVTGDREALRRVARGRWMLEEARER